MSGDSGKSHSRAITDGPNRAPARAMFKAIGFTDEDLSKPIIGIANTWTEVFGAVLHGARVLCDLQRQVQLRLREQN